MSIAYSVGARNVRHLEGVWGHAFCIFGLNLVHSRGDTNNSFYGLIKVK